MDDILDRLRNCMLAEPLQSLVEDAAAEIRNLRDHVLSLKFDVEGQYVEIKRLQEARQKYAVTRRSEEMRSPTRVLMHQLFEQQDKFLTLDIGPFGDGSDSDNVQVGPNMGFTTGSFVMSFDAGSNQHCFNAEDAQAVRNLIEAMQGWLDWVDSGCVRTTEEG